jgi:hypothetical protein
MMINVKGRLMNLASPRVMGIINITDNSFFAGRLFYTSGFRGGSGAAGEGAGMQGNGSDHQPISRCGNFS